MVKELIQTELLGTPSWQKLHHKVMR